MESGQQQTDNAQLQFQQPTTKTNSVDVVSIDLPAPPGWSKKFTPKKGGTPRRNEIVFIAPTGEEIKSKRQLEKYLKSHSGGPSLSEFDWGTGDTPRRSSRLRSRPEATETPESGSSRKRQKRSSSKAEEEKEETDNRESDENDVADKTELEKDVKVKGEEKVPVEKPADEEKAPLQKTADEAGLDTIEEKADETEQQGQDSKVAGLSDDNQIQPEDIKPKGEIEQGNAPVPEEAAGQGNTHFPEGTAPGKGQELPAENKVDSVIEQVEAQLPQETVQQSEDNKPQAGDHHSDVALPENKNAVDEQSAGNIEAPEKEFAGDQAEAYNLAVNADEIVFEAAPTNVGVKIVETNKVQEDVEMKMSSEEVGIDNNDSTKENQEAVKHNENNSVNADTTTHEPSGAPPISC